MPYKSSEKEKERCRIYAAKNKVAIAARMKRWRAANREKLRAYANRPEQKEKAAKWWKENRAKANEYQRQWRIKNPERAKEIDRLRRIKYKEKNRIQWREYARKNRDKFRAGSRKWLKENPERAMDHSVAYRTKKRLSGQRLSRGLTKKLFAEQNGLCKYCSCDLNVSGFHRDHITPISKGGLHEDANIQLTCPACNISKGNRAAPYCAKPALG